MRARWVVLISVFVVICAGAFFAGRAAVSQEGVPAEATLTSSDATLKFNPVSVSFVSPDSGWALGTIPCKKYSSCLSLLQTTNAGRSWLAKILPHSLIKAADRNVASLSTDFSGAPGLNVRFANERDGWIYGSLPGPVPKSGNNPLTNETILWSTHDGGQLWTKQFLKKVNPQGGIFDLEASARTVYLLAWYKSDEAIVESSPVGEDNWRASNATRLYLPAGGAQPVGAIFLKGKSGWLVVGNDRGISASARLNSADSWVRWTPPCQSVGDSYTVLAVTTTRKLFAECVMGGFASPLSRAAPRGASIDSTWLYISDNAGQNFAAGPELGRSDVNFEWILASPTPSTILIARNYSPHEQMLASFDGGRHWSVVYSGDVSFVRFVSPTEGVALVQSSNDHNQLIITFDGGRHWSPISV